MSRGRNEGLRNGSPFKMNPVHETPTQAPQASPPQQQQPLQTAPQNTTPAELQHILCSCKNCHERIGRFANCWIKIGKNHYSPVVLPEKSEVTGVKAKGEPHPGGEGLLENSYLQDLGCKNCNETLGLRCEGGSGILQKNQLILRLPSMSIVSEASGEKASPVVQRSLTIAQDSNAQSTQRDADSRMLLNTTITEPLPSQSQPQHPPPPHAQMQAPSHISSPAHPQPQPQFVNGHAPGHTSSPAHPQSQPQLMNGHAQHAMPSSPDPMRELQQFAQWASSAIENSNRDILRLGNAVNNIEKDMRNFNVLLNDLRNEVMAKPGARDITALRSEIQVLRESRNEAVSGVKGQKLSVDEFEVLTENMSRISEKANAVDDLKMQVDFLKSRAKRLEEVTRGIQSFSSTHPTPGPEPRNSPQNHISPFVPSMNHGLPSALHGPLSGRENLPNQVPSANHTPALPRKREIENVNLLTSIPSAYQSDENEHPQKRYKYTTAAFPGDQSMVPKEYRSLAAQPNLGTHEARTFVMADNGEFKPSHPGFVADPLTPKPKAMAFRGGGRGRGRGAGNTGREMGRVSQYSPPPQDSVERPYASYEGGVAGTTGGDWLGSNPAVSAARTSEPYLDAKATRRNSEGVVLTKNGRPDGRSIKRRPIQRNSDGIPVTRSGKPDGRFLAARSRKHEGDSQSPVPSGLDEHSVDSVISQEVATPTPTAEQLVVVEKETATNGHGDDDAREELVPVTPLLAAAPVPLPVPVAIENTASN